MLKQVRLFAVVPVLVLALAGCANSVEPATVSIADTPPPAPSDDYTPPTGTLDTTMPTYTPTPAPDYSKVAIITGTGEDKPFVKGVVAQYGFTAKKQRQALAFGREVCDNEVNSYNEQEDAIANADDSFDDDDVNTTVATLAENALCPGEHLSKDTKKFVKLLHSTNWVVTSTSGVVSVTWSEDFNISQANGVGSPWKKSFDDSSDVTITAQNGGGGTISCYQVSATGEKFDKHSSTGAYAVVTCS